MLHSVILRLASELPQGDPTRRRLLAALREARRPYPSERSDIEEQSNPEGPYDAVARRHGLSYIPDLRELPKRKAVVINVVHGGFGLSKDAIEIISAILGKKIRGDEFDLRDEMRAHPALLWVVENLGKKADGPGSGLEVVPVSGKFLIQEYDGYERIITPSDLKWISV